MFRSIKVSNIIDHPAVGTRGPSGCGVAAGEAGLLIEAVSAAGHRSLGGNGGGCDIDIAGEAIQGYLNGMTIGQVLQIGKK
jgi:hypothetical protein